MEKPVIKIFSTEYEIHYIDAVVVHTDKYNDRIGFHFWYIIFNNTIQDVVFKLRNTGLDINCNRCYLI